MRLFDSLDCFIHGNNAPVDQQRERGDLNKKVGPEIATALPPEHHLSGSRYGPSPHPLFRSCPDP